MSEDNQLSDLIFRSPSGGHFKLGDLIGEVKNYFNDDPVKDYILMLGTDSEEREEGVEFVTALVVYKKGFGGRYFWRTSFISKTFHSIFERIWEEAITSLKMSTFLLEKLKDVNSKFSFELHVDVGDKGETKNIIREIVWSLKNSGFLVKTKPESIAASKVADRHL